MGRSGRLTQPHLSEGAKRNLNDQLHLLHQYAKFPSTTELATALAGHGVAYASRTTIYNAFCSTRLAKAGLVDALVVELAGRVRNATEEQIDWVGNAFSNLWFLAEYEDRYGPPVRSEPTMAQDASEPEANELLALPAAHARLPTPLTDLDEDWWAQPDQRISEASPEALESLRESLRRPGYLEGMTATLLDVTVQVISILGR